MSWLQEAMESGYEPTLAEIEQDLDMEAELNLFRLGADFPNLSAPSSTRFRKSSSEGFVCMGKLQSKGSLKSAGEDIHS
jgi:hypothetical protein